MNKDINIVLNGASAAAASFDVADGVVSISSYPFPWKKIQKASKTVSVAKVDAVQNAKITAVAAGIEYSFILTQRVGGDLIVERIAYTAFTGDTYTNVSAGWKAIVDAHAASGRIKVASTAISTVTNADDVLTITSADAYALMSVSNASNSVTLNIAGATTGVAAVNAGADLLAIGIADSFDSDLPASGTNYTLYDWSLKLPKGKGGFNGQTDDQDVSLKLFVQEGQAGTAALVIEIDYVLAGLNPGGTGSDELLGQD
jgi:hypothetical protein